MRVLRKEGAATKGRPREWKMVLAAESAAVTAEAQKDDNPDNVTAGSGAAGAATVVIAQTSASESVSTAAKQKD